MILVNTYFYGIILIYSHVYDSGSKVTIHRTIAAFILLRIILKFILLTFVVEINAVSRWLGD